MDIRPWPEVQAILPPLGDADRDALRASIAEHGVKYPVLVLPDGRIIDGHHRWELSGGLAPTRVEEIDETTGLAIAVALNVGRRQMTAQQVIDVRTALRANREAARRVVEEMARQGKTQREIGRAIGYSDRQVRRMTEEGGSTGQMSASTTSLAPAYRKIAPEDEALIRARIAAGESKAAIARDYGVTHGAIRQFLARCDERRANPRPKIDPRRLFTDEQEDRIESRYRVDGESFGMLAVAYECSPGTIRAAIERARSRWVDGKPPASLDAPPRDNVVDFAERANTHRPTRPAPPKPDHLPIVIQREAVRWLGEARLLKDRLEGLRSRFGDALVDALATSAEGAVMGRELDQMAEEFRALADEIRRGNAGEDRQRDGSTGH